MHLNRILTAAALTMLASAPFVTSSPAFAQMFQEGLTVHIPMPSTPGSRPQAPMLGGQGTITQTPKPNVQTAQVPDQGEGMASPTFVAPGVERNAAGQIERSL
jgi:hypothetical protein